MYGIAIVEYVASNNAVSPPIIFFLFVILNNLFNNKI